MIQIIYPDCLTTVRLTVIMIFCHLFCLVWLMIINNKFFQLVSVVLHENQHKIEHYQGIDCMWTCISRPPGWSPHFCFSTVWMLHNGLTEPIILLIGPKNSSLCVMCLNKIISVGFLLGALAKLKKTCISEKLPLCVSVETAYSDHAITVSLVTFLSVSF